MFKVGDRVCWPSSSAIWQIVIDIDAYNCFEIELVYGDPTWSIAYPVGYRMCCPKSGFVNATLVPNSINATHGNVAANGVYTHLHLLQEPIALPSQSVGAVARSEAA